MEGTYRVSALLHRSMDEPTPAAQQADLDQVQAQRAANSAHYAELRKRIDADVEKAALDHVIEIGTPYNDALQPVTAQLAAHDSAAARATLLKVMPLQHATLGALTGFASVEQQAIDAAVAASEHSYAVACAVLWGLGVAALVTAATLALWVTQQNPALVEQASAAALSMADQAQSLRDAVAMFKVGNRELSVV